jgi:hypothetical protein
MPIVDKGTLDTLKAAVESPSDYSTGEERNELRAAFDIATSQITNHVFKFEAKNRMMVRRRLNKIEKDSIPQEYQDLIEALRKALASCEPLQSKHYSDDDEETVAFIESELSALVECL